MNNNAMNNGTMNNEAVNAKASAILKARLPHHTEARHNFEKRTGNFFVASTIKDEATGEEKLTRKVVEDANIAEVCHEEMKQKRAAAFVLGYESKLATADEAIAKAEQLLAEAKAYRDTLGNEYTDAVAVVEACELPEKAERVTLTATVEAQKSEIERLKALLASAGIEAYPPTIPPYLAQKHPISGAFVVSGATVTRRPFSRPVRVAERTYKGTRGAIPRRTPKTPKNRALF